MGKSQETFSKKEKEKKRLKKRQEKLARREERKANPKKTFEESIAYIDENGNFTDTPPDATKKSVIKAEDIVLGVPSMIKAMVLSKKIQPMKSTLFM